MITCDQCHHLLYVTVQCGVCRSREIEGVRAEGSTSPLDFVAEAPLLTNGPRPVVFAVVDPAFPDLPIEVFASRPRANAWLASVEAEPWDDLRVVELEAEEA